ncbi:MAG: hypothetical protein JXR83_12675, partial [Deltaproteobacteria bacterium]|nr:hypothetical protein [Deltaproteobacteria bacterium]
PEQHDVHTAGIVVTAIVIVTYFRRIAAFRRNSRCGFGSPSSKFVQGIAIRWNFIVARYFSVSFTSSG